MTSMNKRRTGNVGSRKHNVYVVLQTSQRNDAQIIGVFSTNDKAEARKQDEESRNDSSWLSYSVFKHTIM